MTAPVEGSVTGGSFFTRSSFGNIPNWAWIALAVAGLFIFYQFRKSSPTAASSSVPSNTTPPNVFVLPPGVYPFPTPGQAPTPVVPTPSPTNTNPYPGVPRPDATKVYITKAGDTWASIMAQLFPNGSTNPAAMKAWHASHGGDSRYGGYRTFGAGTRIMLPAHAGHFLTPGHLSVNGNPNA